MRRHVCLLLLVILLLPACEQGSALGITTASPTSFARLATRLEPTATIPNQPPGILPESDAHDYFLKPWDADQTWKIIQLALTITKDYQHDNYQDWVSVKLTLLREFVSRFPDSPHFPDAIDLLNSPQSYYAPSIPVTNTLEPFRFAFEAALNARPDIEISQASIMQLINHLFNSDYFTINIIPADNVLGGGKTGWIIEFRNDYYAAVLVVSGSAGAYRIISLSPNWTNFSWSDQKVLSYDLNGNGIPEIAIEESHWTIGMAHFCTDILHLYEWNGTEFVDLTPNIQMESNIAIADCLGFEMSPGPNGTQAIITGYKTDIWCDVDDNSNSGGLIIRRRYEWNGFFFGLVDQETEPLEDSMPTDYSINNCTLSWVNEVGPMNDQAFHLLSVLLRDPSMTDALAKQFGMAYLDFFHFKLGTWYAIRGQRTNAVALLTQVRDNPTHPEYKAASQLAKAFLDKYIISNAYAGCAAAQQVLNFEDFYSFPPDYDELSMRKTWGFSDPLWRFSPSYSFSVFFPSEDPWNVCSLPAAFRLSIQNQSFSDTKSLKKWLDGQGIPYTGLIEGDIDQDGRGDWLLLAGTGDRQVPELWAILNKGNQILPLLIAGDYFSASTDSNIPVAYNTFTPDSSIGRLNVYQTPRGLIIFKIVSENGWIGVDTMYYDLYSSGPFLNFSVRPAEDNGQGPINRDQLYLRMAGNPSYEEDWNILGWDKKTSTLKVLSSPQMIRENQLHDAENLIFSNGNFTAAIVALPQLLDGKSDLPESYLRYLIGLAYEKGGNQEKAVSAYFELWQDFPQDPFSYIVQQKLLFHSP